jgi:hypothetical protein
MLDRRFGTSFAIGAVLSMSLLLPAPAQTDMAAQSATVGPFESKSEAEAFLARALPAATAANPKYRSPGGDVETRWLMRTISFKDNEGGGLIVSTDEAVEDYRADKLSAQRTHTATFAIDDVVISEETTDDLAENGERARGVLFKCAGAPCIRAVWSGENSISDSTDVYLQDDTQRRRILDAFQALRRKPASP